MSRIGIRTNEEDTEKLIQETVNKTTESIKKMLEETGSGQQSTKSKVSQILAGASNPQSQDDVDKEKEKLEEVKKKERMEFDKEIEKMKKDIEESEVECPLCSKHDHKHTLKKTDKGTLQCTGDGCKTEYSLVPNNSEYYCDDCHTPHKKPESPEDQKSDSCPFCGSKAFTKSGLGAISHDYDTIRKRVANRNK